MPRRITIRREAMRIIINVPLESEEDYQKVVNWIDRAAEDGVYDIMYEYGEGITGEFERDNPEPRHPNERR